MPRPSRYYPALLIALLTTCLLFQYKNHHRPAPIPLLAITPPPYTNTPIHLSAATLPFPDFLDQLTRQCPVPIQLLFTIYPATMPLAASQPATQPAIIFLPTADFLLADLPALLYLNPANNCTAAFDPGAVLLGDMGAFHDPSRAITRAYAVADLITPDFLSDDPLSYHQDQLEDLIVSVVDPDTWRDRGGRLATFKWSGTTAVITTTPDLHLQIDSLLNTLRHL